MQYYLQSVQGQNGFNKILYLRNLVLSKAEDLAHFAHALIRPC